MDNRQEKRALSQKQQEILECIKNSILSRGYPPSVREIGEEVHLSSSSSVHAQLNKLENMGYIRRDPTKPRAIEIADDSFYMARRDRRPAHLCGREYRELYPHTSRIPSRKAFIHAEG